MFKSLKNYYGLQFKNAMKEIKGARRDPLFYLRGLAFLLFFLIIGVTLFMPMGEGGSTDSQEKVYLSAGQNLFVAASGGKIYPFTGIVLNNSSLVASLPSNIIQSRSLTSFAVTEPIAGPRNGILEYIVQDGDSVSLIADKFGLSLNTLLWANDLSSKSKVKPGQKLVILPVDGLIHHVKDGDTISQLAKAYQIKTDDIISFNDLASNGDIYMGDILIIPGGKPPVVSSVVYAPSSQTPVASTYFISPLGSSRRLTQGLHWYNAVDFDGDCGQPVFAAAEGTIQRVSLTSSTSRWALNGAGNHITILHPNGLVTFYGHLKTALVSRGQHVSQGQMIATVGGQPGTPGAGLSTGCHLHFGVTGGRNPFAPK